MQPWPQPLPGVLDYREFRRAVAHLKQGRSPDTLLTEAESREWRIVPLLLMVAEVCRECPGEA